MLIIIICSIYSLIFLLFGFYLYIFKKFIIKPKVFKIIKIIRESDDSENIFLKQLSGKPIIFEPGQYTEARIKGLINFLYISSTPKEKDLSLLSNKKLNVSLGDKVLIEGPFGISNKQIGGQLIFIVEHNGIAPIISILRNMKLSGKRVGSKLIYQNETDKNEPFKNELRLLRRSKWFSMLEAYTKKFPPLKGQKLKQYKGKITKTLMKRELKKKHFENSSFYISGSYIFIRNCKKWLKFFGVRKKCIYIYPSLSRE
ncbi:hypothetical protein ACFL1M_00715 [Patescibacteria group bacterium]